MMLYEEIFREFQNKKAKYVVVGGIAFNLLGGARNTLDMDILVEMSDENLRKIVSVLKKAGYHVKQPVDPMLIADKNKRDNWIKNKNMRAFNFYKGLDTYEEVDIVINSPVSFEEVYKSALDVSEKGLRFKVISPRYFVKMKKASGRDKDLDDIKKLKMVRKDI